MSNTKTVKKNAIDEALAEIEQMRLKVEGWRSLAEWTANELIPQLEALPEASPSIYDDWQLDVGYHSGMIQGVLLKCQITDFRALSPIRKYIREHGFSKPEIKDWQPARRRTFVYRRDNEVLTLAAFLPSDGAKCEFVQVGEEKTPIYEVRCNGNAETASDLGN